MAFPSSNTRRTLQSALDGALSQAAFIKRTATQHRDRMASIGTQSDGLLTLLDQLKGAREQIISHVPVEDPAVVDALVALAQEQLGVNVEQDFYAMLGAVDAVQAALVEMVPQDADGYMLVEVLNADGSRTRRSFQPEELQNVVAALDNLIASID